MDAKIRKEIEWRLLVDRFVVSGQTKADFARENQIPYSTLGFYIKKHAPLLTKPRLAEKEKNRLVKEFLASSLSESTFAKQNGVSAPALGDWLDKYDPDRKGREEQNKRRNYFPGGRSREFKEELLAEYLKSDLTLGEFSKLKGFSRPTICRWFETCDPGAVRRQQKNQRMGYVNQWLQ